MTKGAQNFGRHSSDYDEWTMTSKTDKREKRQIK